MYQGYHYPWWVIFLNFFFDFLLLQVGACLWLHHGGLLHDLHPGLRHLAVDHHGGHQGGGEPTELTKPHHLWSKKLSLHGYKNVKPTLLAVPYQSFFLADSIK